MRFGVLGALTVTYDGVPIELGGPKERAVLARLLVANGEAVPVPALVESVWGEDAPPSAVKTLQTYVLRLRQALEPGRESGAPAQVLLRTSGGYRLDVPGDAVDAGRFEELVSAGRAALAARPGETVGLLTEALALWRGPAYAGVEDGDVTAAEAARLEELRLAALEDLQDARLAAGSVVEAVADLRRLVQQHPLRERLWSALLLALYRSGRQSEALAAYGAARRRLAEDIGVEPGPTLRRLHAAVLAQDPALLPAAPAPLPPELAAATGPLLGRNADLEWLRAAWRRTLADGPRAVALVGPPGIGKTRLAAELAREVHRTGAVVEYAAGAPGPGPRTGPTLVVLDASDDAPILLGGPVLTVVLESAPRSDLPNRNLEPLPASAAAALAADVLGTAALAHVGGLVERSGGVPARVLALARKHAHDVAAAQVATASTHTRERTADLAATRSELVTGIERLQALDMHDREDGRRCPFPGLASFDVADAPAFFGRERLVAELVARLAGTRLVAIVGPSGSGKSSVARAGLLAALRGGALPGSSSWAQVVVRPGERPVRELARVLLRGTADTDPDSIALLLDRLVLHAGEPGGPVLLVDQFEEIFTTCADDEERAAFVELLLDASARGVHVVAALRADYFGHCAAYPRLAASLADAAVLVPPMLEAELRRAIERPAALAGLRLDEGLTDALVADVPDRAGGLPLLAATLRELWEGRTGDRLTLARYAAVGGVRGAVARLSDAAFSALPTARRRETARRLLLRLTGPGEGESVVRRRVALAEFRGLPDRDVPAVLDALAARRLLTLGEEYVELTHEAVLREWPRLKRWLEEDRQGRAVHRRLVADAAAWAGEGRDRSSLYRGTRLAAAAEWADAHPDELTGIETEFVAAGRAELDRETERARREARAVRRVNRRLRGLLAAAALLTVAAVVAGTVAVQQRGRSQREATLAEARSLAAAGLVEPTLDRALLLAAAGVRLDSTVETRGALLSVLARAPAAAAALRTEERLFTLDVSADGRTVVAGAGSPGGLHVWTGVARRHRLLPTPAGAAWDVRLSPDARSVAVWFGSDRLDLFGYDLASGRLLWHLVPPDLTKNETLADNGGLSYSPDGSLLAANTGAGVAVIDDRTHRVVRTIPLQSTAGGLAFLPDGTLLVTAEKGHAVSAWDARRGLRLRALPLRGPIAAAAHAAVVLGTAVSGSPAVLDLRTGRLVTGNAPGTPLATSGDGRLAATASPDRSVTVWDTSTMSAVDSLPGHTGPVTAASFTDDGQLLTASHDGSVLVWKRDRGSRLAYRPPLAVPPLDEAVADASGTTLLARGTDLRIWLLEVASGRRAPIPGSFESGTMDMALAARPGRAPLFALPGGETARFSAGTLFAGPRPVRLLTTARHWVDAVALSADGSRLATVLSDTLSVVDPRTWRPLGPPAAVRDCDQCPIAFSADGRRVAVSGGDGVVHAVDVQTGRDLTLRVPATVTALAWAGPDTIGYGTQDGRVELWRPGGRRLAMAGRHAGQVLSVASNPDRSLLASGAVDGTVRLWDAGTGTPMGEPLPGPNVPRVWVAFRADGGLLAVYGDGTARIWRLDPATWTGRACAIAGREFTRAELRAVAPSATFRPVCGT